MKNFKDLRITNENDEKVLMVYGAIKNFCKLIQRNNFNEQVEKHIVETKCRKVKEYLPNKIFEGWEFDFYNKNNKYASVNHFKNEICEYAKDIIIELGTFGVYFKKDYLIFEFFTNHRNYDEDTTQIRMDFDGFIR